jgi:hypothetical protein
MKYLKDIKKRKRINKINCKIFKRQKNKPSNKTKKKRELKMVFSKYKKIL